MNDTLKRVVWILLAVLFLFTALGVGVYSFWQGTHSSSNKSSSYIKCQDQTAHPPAEPKAGTPLKGTKLTGFTPIKHIDLLDCIDFKIGAGSVATATSTVTVNYTGALASDGTIFESSLDSGQPATLALNQVIQGWSAGVPGMKVGGTRRLLIPAQYGYGAQGSGSIPPNSDLVFDITLINVQ
jgi:FKBP-type peptidyl-prolyl cis-trans isomerase